MATLLQIPHGRAARSSKLEKLLADASGEDAARLVKAVKDAASKPKGEPVEYKIKGRSIRLAVATSKPSK